jgi:hypothetical protein
MGGTELRQECSDGVAATIMGYFTSSITLLQEILMRVLNFS